MLTTEGRHIKQNAVSLLTLDWRLALSCLWGVPVAFSLLFGSRKLAASNEAADRIVVLADGRVKENGSPAELEAQNGVFAHMTRLQREAENWSIV